VFGDISSTIYPVNGGLEDWAYGAGWDYTAKDSTLNECNPSSYALRGVTQGHDHYKNIRSAIYIVETDHKKHPDEDHTWGSRLVHKGSDGRLKVDR
jgi:hypothetical protein